MARLIKISGLPTVLRNLRSANDKIGMGIGRGLKRAGIFLQRESMKIVPVDLGNLKATATTRNVGGIGFRTDIIVSYGSSACDYAIYVHENLEALHGERFNVAYADRIASATTPAQKKKWSKRGPNQQAKFLEKPAREKKSEIIAIITREAKRL